MGEFEEAVQSYDTALRTVGGGVAEYDTSTFPVLARDSMKLLDGLGLALAALGMPRVAQDLARFRTHARALTISRRHGGV